MRYTKWYSTRHSKYDFTRHEIKSTWGQIKPNTEKKQKLRKVRKTQNFILGGGNLWWPSLISYHVVIHFGWLAITRTHKNDFTIQNRLATKTKHHKVWINLQLEHEMGNDLVTLHKITYLFKMQNAQNMKWLVCGTLNNIISNISTLMCHLLLGCLRGNILPNKKSLCKITLYNVTFLHEMQHDLVTVWKMIAE